MAWPRWRPGEYSGEDRETDGRRVEADVAADRRGGGPTWRLIARPMRS